MAIRTFAELETAIANWSHRGDLTTAQIDEFIALAEADMRVRANLTEWDTEADVTITDGSGPLPSDFASLKGPPRWSTESRSLTQVSPSKYLFLAENTDPAEPINYCIIGDTLRVVPAATGTASILYTARFEALSASNTQNSLIDMFPDAYLNGAMVQFSLWAEDDAKLQKYSALYEVSLQRVKRYTSDRRYGDAPLAMRVG